jgi:cytochrome c peroxidase
MRKRLVGTRLRGTKLLGSILGLAAIAIPWLGIAQTPGLLPFSEGEIKAILSHGPWPTPWSPDPTNRVSGRPAAIDLGERLFFDPRLSRDGTVSCSTCHVPDRNWTDNEKRGVGLAAVDRNTPALMNMRALPWFAWDGAADSLWSQSTRPLLDPRELGSNPRHVADFIRKDGDLSCRYEKAFGTPVGTDDEAVLVAVGKALAAFEETLVTGATSFDAFRNAVARSDWKAAAHYSENAQRGLRIFIGKGQCSTCHAGPNFTNGEFHDTGVRLPSVSDTPDGGRQAGIRKLLESRFNLLGPYNDDAAGTTAAGTRRVALEPHGSGFRVPSLRNAVITAPYMHNGEFGTLREVIEYYSNLDESRPHAPGARALKPLKLRADEVNDLLVFVESLTQHNIGWRNPPPPAPCVR